MSILITIIGFGLMIFLHELGHFITAKRFGVLVHEFSIGMGPKIASFKKNETQYSLRLLPLGGYVKLESETEADDVSDPRSFMNLAPIKRIIILSAGAFMNILLGFLIFVIINLNAGITPPVIDSVLDEYSEQSVFLAGDEIISLNNTRVHTFDDVSLFMSRYNNPELSVTIKRDGEIKVIEKMPLFETQGGYRLGVAFKSAKAPFLKCAQFAVYDTIYITKAVIFALGDVITGRIGVNTLSGPVEIVSVVDAVASTQSDYTYLSVLLLFAMISVNLGVFNLLPFPALDGGSIIFALYELITKRKLKSEIIGYATTAGFVLLLLLAIYVTAGDILELIK